LGLWPVWALTLASGRNRTAIGAPRPRAERVGLALIAVIAAATQPGAASEPLHSSDASPEIRFTGSTYELTSRNSLHLRDYEHGGGSADMTNGVMYFGTMVAEDTRTGPRDPLVYAGEGMSGAPIPQHCGGDDACFDLGVGVAPTTGRLHLFVERPGRRARRHRASLGTADWPAQDVEVSVTDPGSNLKVFHEIEVLAPSDAPDCSGYPAMDPDRFTCLFLREELPAEAPRTTAALLAGLPNLVQPAENYQLVFEEEFEANKVDRSGGCANRMGNLDSDVWNYDRDPCDNTDSRGDVCFNLGGGGLSIAVASGCGSTLGTEGKFTYRYGYLEIRYTVELKYPGFYANFAAVQWAGGFRQSLVHQHDRYGVVVDSYEDFGKYVGAELDLFEFVPQRSGHWGGIISMHQYMNWSLAAGAHVDHPAVLPRRADKFYQLRCGFDGQRCHGDREMTLTSGFEWTPRGYSTFGKLRGSSSNFVKVPEKRVLTRYKRKTSDGFGFWRDFSWGQRRQLFEELEPGNPETMLEQIAIAHIPANVDFVAWGYPEDGDPIGTRVKIHYVRVFQPTNRYTDMEPVYK